MKNKKEKKIDLSPDETTELKRSSILRELAEAPISKEEIDSIKTLTETNAIIIAGGDLNNHVRNIENFPEIDKTRSKSHYHDIIFALVQIRLSEEEAQKDWMEILRHKYTVSQQLDRNIGIHVATLDYYQNIKRYVENPKIVDAMEYTDTASHALIDELTKAYNRRFFDGKLDRMFKYADAFGKTFSLIMLDLDHFKFYNDQNGHINGDIALIETVRLFHAVCGNRATVCRYGGEEFAVFIDDKDLSEALILGEELREAICNYRFVNEQKLPSGKLTVSIGVASFHTGLVSGKTILEEADKALYKAKANGRNRVEKL